MLQAALYLNGNIVTGITHGDAFSQLPEKDKTDSNIISGHFDKTTGEFFTEKENFYTKQIIFIRHGSTSNYENLSEKGIDEIERMALYLRNKINLIGYKGIVSPAPRCLETADIIAYYTRLMFEIIPEVEQIEELEETTNKKLKNVINKLPEKSLMISHSPIIKKLTQFAIGGFFNKPIPTGSITIVNKKQTICSGFKY